MFSYTDQNLAPVILFVYNRPDHTLKTLQALYNNELSAKTTLFVFADGIKTDANENDKSNIEKVRKLIRQKAWCKEVIVIEADKNKGLANSIIEGVTSTLEKYDKVIVLEDDIITGRGFLNYMNEALIMYENDSKVASVHAHNFPIKTKGLHTTFFLRGADCWGWGTWKSRWSSSSLNSISLYEGLIRKKLSFEFDLEGAYPYTAMLKDEIEGTINSWAIRWHAFNFLEDKLTLHPAKSLIRNIGLDGSGTHCRKGRGEGFRNFVDYCDVEKIDVVESKEAVRQMIKYHSQQRFSSERRLKVFRRLMRLIRSKANFIKE